MRKGGEVLMGIAFITLLAALGMDTSISTESGGRVHNIGLMRQQENLMLLAIGLFIGGAILFARGSKTTIADRQRSDGYADNAGAESKNESVDGMVSLLERLAKLKEQGVLSEEEFNIQKARILLEHAGPTGESLTAQRTKTGAGERGGSPAAGTEPERATATPRVIVLGYSPWWPKNKIIRMVLAVCAVAVIVGIFVLNRVSN